MEGKSVREVVLEHKMLDEDKLNKILDPYEMTKAGIAGKELLNN